MSPVFILIIANQEIITGLSVLLVLKVYLIYFDKIDRFYNIGLYKSNQSSSDYITNSSIKTINCAQWYIITQILH